MVVSCQKKNAYYSKAYLDFIREQPCCISGKKAVPAHQRDASNAGTAIKPSDTYALPLNPEAHIQGEHAQGKETFWGSQDPYQLCVRYLSKYFKKKLYKDFKSILIRRLFDHLEKEMDINPFKLTLNLYRDWVLIFPSHAPKNAKKKIISLIFDHLDKVENVDPYRLSIELITDYLRENS